MLEIDKITSSIKRKPINAYIFMTCVCLYLLNEACFKHIDVYISCLFFNYYFNDCLASLLFFSYSNILLLTRGHEIIKLKQLWGATFINSILWEYVAALVKTNSVTDNYDILCYFFSSTVYWALLKANKRRIIK